MISYLYKLLLVVDKLKDLHEYGGNLYIEVNPHVGRYESIEKHLEIEDKENNAYSNIDDETLIERCKENNKLITIQLYPTSPVGSYTVFGVDIDDTAKQMLETLIKCEVMKGDPDGTIQIPIPD